MQIFFLTNQINTYIKNTYKSHRKDVDGIRALAVLAVIIGHFNDKLLPGGFLGVDVFFVISGFVITLSLLNRQKMSFFHYILMFFTRRFKRIFPALIVCVLVTSIILIWIDTSPNESLFTGIWSLVGFSNLYLYFQQLDYFADSVKYNAFTHTWSLGVEEQFYLIFPFIVFFITKHKVFKNIDLATLFVFILFIASFVLFSVMVLQDQQYAYYWMPARFWQLSLGALIAIYLNTGRFNFLSYLGPWFYNLAIFALLCSMFVFAEKTYWGHISISVLTATIILLGARRENRSIILTNPLALFIGYISYSLYLWHWPILVFERLSSENILSNFSIYFFVTLIVSSISYFAIERPIISIRHDKTPTRWGFGLALTSILSSAFILIFIAGFKSDIRAAFNINFYTIENAFSPPMLPLPISELPFNPTCVVDGNTRPLTDKTFSNCTFTPKQETDPMVWVMGDSHAGHLQGMLVKMYQTHGIGFHLIETPGRAFPLQQGMVFAPRLELYSDAEKQWRRGDTLLISRLFLSREGKYEVVPDFDSWLNEVKSMANNLDKLSFQKDKLF